MKKIGLVLITLVLTSMLFPVVSDHAAAQVGTQKWAFTAGDHVSSPAAIGSDGTIYVGSRDSKLYAINPNGTQKWAFTTGDQLNSSPAIGSDGTIYAGSWDNKFYAIYGNSGGLARSPWPMFHHDLRHTGRVSISKAMPWTPLLLLED